jgi:hypothetical protein
MPTWMTLVDNVTRHTGYKTAHHTLSHRHQPDDSAQLIRVSADHRACMVIAAAVPHYAKECRFVRVICVLIFSGAEAVHSY